MNRHAIAIFSDVVWFITFVIAAVVLFFAGFNPLKSGLETDVNTAQLLPHADFIAHNLPSLTVDRPGIYLHKPFGALLIDYGNLYAPASFGPDSPQRKAFESSDAFNDYKPFVMQVFENPSMQLPLEPASTAAKKPRNALHYRLGYVVVLRQGDAYLEGTCVEIPVSHTGLCDVITNAPMAPDAASGLAMPAVTLDRFVLDTGTIYVPTDNQPLIMHVFVAYSTAPLGDLSMASGGYNLGKVGSMPGAIK